MFIMKGRYFLQIPQSLFAINKEIIQGEKQNEYPKNELAHTAVCRLKNIEEIATPSLDTLENGVLRKNSPRHPFQKRNVVNGREHLRNHLIHCFFMAECLVQTTRFLGNERDDEKHRCDDDEDNECTGKGGCESRAILRLLQYPPMRLLKNRSEDGGGDDSREKWLEQKKCYHPDRDHQGKKEIDVQMLEIHMGKRLEVRG